MTKTEAAEQFSSKMADFGHKVADGVKWTGRQVKEGFDKLLPKIQPIFQKCVEFLRTGFGLAASGIVLGGALIALACFSEKLDKDPSQPKIELDKNTVKRVAIVAAGALMIFGSITLMAAFGTAAVV